MKKSKVWMQILADESTDRSVREAYDRHIGATRGHEKAGRLFKKADLEMKECILEVMGYRVVGEDTPDAVALKHMAAFSQLERANYFHELRRRDLDSSFNALRTAILTARGIST